MISIKTLKYEIWIIEYNLQDIISYQAKILWIKSPNSNIKSYLDNSNSTFNIRNVIHYHMKRSHRQKDV